MLTNKSGRQQVRTESRSNENAVRLDPVRFMTIELMVTSPERKPGILDKGHTTVLA